MIKGKEQKGKERRGGEMRGGERRGNGKLKMQTLESGCLRAFQGTMRLGTMCA